MLARTPNSLVYLSAEELCITERERAGLIEVRDHLMSGEMHHAPKADVSWGKTYRSDNAMFNMSIWDCETDCGTCHCIGGDMQARGFLVQNDDDDYGALNPLFYPVMPSGTWHLLTPAQAVRAIDHFLSGAGPDCWPMALADIPL